jgi:hypothetical protein
MSLLLGLRDILQGRAISVANGAAEVEARPFTGEGDAFDPERTSTLD